MKQELVGRLEVKFPSSDDNDGGIGELMSAIKSDIQTMVNEAVYAKRRALKKRKRKDEEEEKEAAEAAEA